MDISNSWFFFAFSAPIIWAIVCLVDSCVVGQNIYRSAWDGPIISGLYSAVPLLIWVMVMPNTALAPPLVDSAMPMLASDHTHQTVKAIGASCLAALMFFLHLYFYFRALFLLNDVANTEAIMALSVVIVPMLAWFLLGERLSGAFYAAIILAFIGLVVTAWSTLCRIAKSAHTKSQNAKRLDMCISLLLAVLCISLSMVMQAKAVEELSFSEITISYSATLFTISLVPVLVSSNYRRKLSVILMRYYPIFLFAEALDIFARLATLRAIETGPSVTVVALVHSTLPILIIILSLLLIRADRVRHFLTPVLHDTLILQSQSIQTKTILLIVTAAAALILQQNNTF